MPASPAPVPLAVPRGAPARPPEAFPYLLILPTALAVLMFDLYPLGYAFALSFAENRPGGPAGGFVGLDNYARTLGDAEFRAALWRTVKWTIGSVSGQLVLGTGLAVLLAGLRRGQRVLTGLLLLPWVTPLVVAALACRWILHAEFGILNAALPVTWLGFSPRHDWLGEASTTLPAILLTHVWKYYGFVMLIVLARLKSVPVELAEAARLDGAGRWGVLAHVTLPQLADVLGVTVVLMLIWTFNTFDLVYLMAPDSRAADVLAVLIWRRFYGSFDYGLAAATAVLMFVVLFALTLAYAGRRRW